MPVRLPLAAVALLGFVHSVQAQQTNEWSRFRGPGGQGIAENAKLPTRWSRDENIVWKVNLPGPGASSPVVFGDRIYLTCYTGYGVPGTRGDMDKLERHLLCLDRDGKIVWQKGIKAKLPESQTIRENHGYAASTPAVDKELVYVFFGKTGVFAFALDGRQVWEANVGSEINGWGSANSPIVYGELLIVNASIESQSVVALDRKTGKEKWRARGIRESWNTPIVVDTGKRKELVLAISGKVLGLNPDTGEQLWSCATDIGWYMVPGLVEKDGVVFCVGGRSNQGLAVKVGGTGDVTRTHRIWTISCGTNVPSPIWHDGHVYWMSDNSGSAFCAEMKTGKIVYDQRLERANQVYASPILADRKLYYLDRGGKSYVLAAKPELEVIATNDLSERGDVFNASPAAWGNRLLIRSDKYLFCIGAKD